MKKLFSIGILVLIFNLIPIQIFSQTYSKTINADLDFSGKMCNGGFGVCYMNTTANKSTANTQISFNKESNELILMFSKTTLDQTNKGKLLNSKLEKDFYLYTFDEDFLLSKELKEALNIKELTKIKQGNYLVKVIKDQIIMKLKLE